MYIRQGVRTTKGGKGKMYIRQGVRTIIGGKGIVYLTIL